MTAVATMFPRAVKRPKPAIDVSMLKVEHNVPPPAYRASINGKYDKQFALMQPGSCVRCEAGETNQISAALRKAIAIGRYPALKGCSVRSCERCEDGHARVWALKI